MPSPSRRNADSQNLRDASRGERLQRVLADAGVASRRACEELIERGEVTVNGALVMDLPAWVDPENDRIVVSGRLVPPPERKIYVMLNKPARTLSTAKDEPGADRRTVVEMVDHPSSDRLFPVGRLDYDTVGLILLTNDGDLANRLTHPRYGVPKTYRVLVKGQLDEGSIKELERGIFLAERRSGQTVGAVRTGQVEIELVSADRAGTVLNLTLREGRNRQVRRMMAAVGYPVKKLERIGMGPVRLKGVARGAWRELTKDEIQLLKRAAAAKRTAEEQDAKTRPKSRSGKGGGARGGARSGSNGGGSGGSGRYPGKNRAPEPEEPKGPGIRRRSMKNAINRADGRPAAPRRPRRDDQADS